MKVGTEKFKSVLIDIFPAILHVVQENFLMNFSLSSPFSI